jgi:hypothetical protein
VVAIVQVVQGSQSPLLRIAADAAEVARLEAAGVTVTWA